MSEASSKSQEQGDLLNLAEDMKASLNIRDRKYHFRTYRQCFVGEEAVSWMLQRKIAIDAEHAVRIGNDMMKLGLFHHVKFEHAFRNKGYFYRFHEYGHESESGDDEPPVASANHPANSIHAKPSVRQRYALAAEVTRINRHLSALKSDLEAQGSTHGTMGDTAAEQVRDTQAQVQQLEGRLKQMEQWQVRLAEQNAFHWSAISLTGGAICLLACLWCLQTLSATSAALLILLIGTAGWLLHVQAGRLQTGNTKQQEALKPINTSPALRRTRSSLVPPSPTYETPEESPSSGRSSSSDDERDPNHHSAKGTGLGLPRQSHPSGRPDSEVLSEPPTMEDFEECPHAPLLLRARQLPYQHFPSCNPCCIPMNSTTPVEVETDQFKGRLSMWVQGLDTSPPDLFQGKRRKTAIVIQGTFKEPLLYENVLTGQEFGRTPTNLPARWLVDSVLLKLAKRISPSMEIGPLSKPYLMVPSVAMAQCIQVSQPGREPDLSQPSAPTDQGLFTETPMVNSEIFRQIRAGKASWLRGDIDEVREDGIFFNHRAQGVPKGGIGHHKLVEGDVIILATGYKRPALNFLPEEVFEAPYGPPRWYLQVFPPEYPSICCNNCTYVNAIGTVGNYHIGIYTRILLMFLVDPLTTPHPWWMKRWIDMTTKMKSLAPTPAFDFFTYTELLYWFFFIVLINPFRWKWALFVFFGVGKDLPARIVEQEDRLRNGLGWSKTRNIEDRRGD